MNIKDSHLKSEKNLAVKFVELLAKKAPTPEEKQIVALIKTALLSDSLSKFLNEFSAATKGISRVKADTVKELIEYAKAHNEAEIRKQNISDQEKDSMVEREKSRLTEVEVWTLGTLAIFGLLES